MSSRTTITVTEDHIRRGLRQSNQYCPIALAAKDAGVEYVSVFPRGFTCWSIRTQWEGQPIPLPPVAAQFAERFDKELPVAPFSFALSSPAAREGGE